MSLSRSLRFPTALVVGALLLAGCSGSDQLKGTVVKDGQGCVPSVALKTTDVPTITKITTAPKKVEKKDLTKAPKGCVADGNSLLTLSLVGATADDAQVFTNTYTDKRPITARLGTGQLLPGLETGLAGMRVGARRQITIPAADAYGKDGNYAQGIGANETLTFVVDLVGATTKPIYCNAVTVLPEGKAGAGKPTKVDMPLEAPTALKKTDLKVGTGEAAKKGNYVTVQYLGVACSTGRQFDSSWDKGEPFPITLGEGTIPGFATGIEGMKVGGVRQLDIPSALAYGAAGQAPIGADEPLVFIIEVQAIADKPPVTTTTTSTTTTTAAPAATTTTTKP